MKEKLQKIREEAIARIKASGNPDALNEVRVSVLGCLLYTSPSPRD